MMREATSALVSATIAFAANFSIWTLYVVLSSELVEPLQLNATEYALLSACPIISGALLRWPVGILCEYFSSRQLFLVQMLLLFPPLLLMTYASTYAEYLIIGLALGVSGTSFTIGIHYVSQWFNSKEQGVALGIFGAGNAGASITLLIGPMVITWWGLDSIGIFFCIGMIPVFLLFLIMAPRPQAHQLTKANLNSRKVLSSLPVWRFALYYYFVFGSFLALILWLPYYYQNAYNLSISEAMNWTLFFAVSSSLVRALGGWYSDRYGGRAVNWWVFWICLICLFFLSYPPTTMTIHGVERDVIIQIQVPLAIFNALVFIIGIAQGFGRASVYKIIQNHYPNDMGNVGGLVSMVGAIGGFTLPILFGLAVDIAGVYSASFMLLYGIAAICMIAMFFAFKTDQYQRRKKAALEDPFLKDINRNLSKKA